MNRLLILPVLLFTLLVGTPASPKVIATSADFQKGLTAYNSGDYATALREWKPLAEQGDAPAQFRLGFMYEKGNGVSQNHKTAAKWYRLAAIQGNAFAQSNLGQMYRKGRGVPQNNKTALKWYRLSAKQGFARSQLRIKQLQKKIAKSKSTPPVVTARKSSPPSSSADYQKGVTAAKSGDFATALREWTPLAKQGDANAQFNLGLMYDNGTGVLQDYKTAVKWYRLAAKQGNAFAQYRLKGLQKEIAKSKNTPPIATAKKSPRRTPRRRSDPNKIVSASSGSGFAVSSDGHVITNYHVINGCKTVKIHHKGKSIPATVVTFDPQNDLALLKGNFRPSTVLPLSTNKPELLQDVYVAGYPFGRKVSTGVKVTKGIISSLTGVGNNFSNIQIDAALQPGNSGGPILDDKGNVVGVAVARLDKIKTLKKLGSLPENTNFGIKTSVVRTILESSNVSSPNPSRSSISKSKLGKMISDGTYYLSCWMTTAQIEKMRSRKVIFQNLD